MKVLIIGKNGQLGHELCEKAEALHLPLTAYSHEELDITDSENIHKTLTRLSPSIVINASAYHVVPDCELYPDQAFLINSIALKTLSEACATNKSMLVTYSTDYVFDGVKGKPYNEDDKPNPLQIYGISKLAGEHIALQYNPNSIVIRTCGIYGGKSGSRSKKGNFVLHIIKQAQGKTKLEVASEQIVNPTYAVDLAKATFDLIQKNVEPGIYHLASEGYCSWAEFAQEIMEQKNMKVTIIPINRSGKSGSMQRPLFSALANKKAKRHGVVLPHWKDAMRRYIKSI